MSIDDPKLSLGPRETRIEDIPVPCDVDADAVQGDVRAQVAGAAEPEAEPKGFSIEHHARQNGAHSVEYRNDATGERYAVGIMPKGEHEFTTDSVFEEWISPAAWEVKDKARVYIGDGDKESRSLGADGRFPVKLPPNTKVRFVVTSDSFAYRCDYVRKKGVERAAA